MDLAPKIYGIPICGGRFRVTVWDDFVGDVSLVDAIISGAENLPISCESSVGKVTSTALDPLDADYDCFSGAAFPGRLDLERGWTIDESQTVTVTNIEELEALMSRAVCSDAPSVAKERLAAARRQIKLLEGVR